MAGTPAGELLIGFGGWNSCCDYDALYFMDAEENWYRMSAKYGKGGHFHIEPTHDGNFVVVNATDGAFLVLVDKVTQVIAASGAIYDLPNENVMWKPFLNPPQKIHAAWVSQAGAFYFAGEKNTLLSVTSP